MLYPLTKVMNAKKDELKLSRLKMKFKGSIIWSCKNF